LGKGSGNGEGCSYTRQTDALGSRTKEDCRCAKGSMGEGKGGEEDGLAPQILPRGRTKAIVAQLTAPA